MKNVAVRMLSIALVAAMGFGISSCKDDEPPVPPKLSFSETEMTVDEDDGTIEVELVLDKAHSKALRIEYDLSGTASDQDAVGTAGADYEIVGEHGVVEIPAGSTSGVIKIEIYSDAMFEQDETIIIEITDTNTDAIEVTADNEVVITIKNDDIQITAAFASTAPQEINEDDGVGFYFDPGDNYLEIPVTLSSAAPVNITVEYSLDGSSYDSLSAFNNTPRPIDPQYYDYFINGTSGSVVIPAGQTTANIQIGVYADFVYEGDETIEITLTGSNGAQIGTAKTKQITIKQQDGKVIALDWNNAAYTNVDMDLFLWVGPSVSNLIGILASSAFGSVTVKNEVIFIPAVVTSGSFGLSHNYYAGSADPMNFKVRFIDLVDDELEDEAGEDVFLATYTAANLNPYETTGVVPPVVQTFRIVDGDFVDITQITVPATHSRTRDRRMPKGVERSTWNPTRPAL